MKRFFLLTIASFLSAIVLTGCFGNSSDDSSNIMGTYTWSNGWAEHKLIIPSNDDEGVCTIENNYNAPPQTSYLYDEHGYDRPTLIIIDKNFKFYIDVENGVVYTNLPDFKAKRDGVPCSRK